MKPYAHPRVDTHCKVCAKRGGGRSDRTRTEKRRARSAARRAIDESMAGYLHPAEVRVIECDAGLCYCGKGRLP